MRGEVYAMTMTDIDLNQLVDADDAEAHAICGVADHLAPRKAMLRRAQAGMPHKKVGNQIVFYRPILRSYMAAQLTGQLAQAGEGTGRK
jgi:hypothetical protein